MGSEVKDLSNNKYKFTSNSKREHETNERRKEKKKKRKGERKRKRNKKKKKKGRKKEREIKCYHREICSSRLHVEPPLQRYVSRSVVTKVSIALVEMEFSLAFRR